MVCLFSIYFRCANKYWKYLQESEYSICWVDTIITASAIKYYKIWELFNKKKNIPIPYQGKQKTELNCNMCVSLFVMYELYVALYSNLLIVHVVFCLGFLLLVGLYIVEFWWKSIIYKICYLKFLLSCNILPMDRCVTLC